MGDKDNLLDNKLDLVSSSSECELIISVTNTNSTDEGNTIKSFDLPECETKLKHVGLNINQNSVTDESTVSPETINVHVGILKNETDTHFDSEKSDNHSLDIDNRQKEYPQQKICFKRYGMRGVRFIMKDADKKHCDKPYLKSSNATKRKLKFAVGEWVKVTKGEFMRMEIGKVISSSEKDAVILFTDSNGIDSVKDFDVNYLEHFE